MFLYQCSACDVTSPAKQHPHSHQKKGNSDLKNPSPYYSRFARLACILLECNPRVTMNAIWAPFLCILDAILKFAIREL